MKSVKLAESAAKEGVHDCLGLKKKKKFIPLLKIGSIVMISRLN